MRAALMAILLAAGLLPLLGGTATANSCTLSTTAVSFGNYNIFSSASTGATGSVTFKCTQSAAITIQLSKGHSTTFNPRTMTFSSSVLNYNLYQDAALTEIWGDGTGGSTEYSNSRPGTGTVVLTVYGNIPALQQSVAAGAYSDSITATITF
jgi:spore coat protein U-like protein